MVHHLYSGRLWIGLDGERHTHETFPHILLKHVRWCSKSCLVTSPIYRTCSPNFRKCEVLCRCHSQQMPNLVFRVLSIPYTLALKATSITVILDHHSHPYLNTISDIWDEGANSEIVLYLPIALEDLKEIDVAELGITMGFKTWVGFG